MVIAELYVLSLCLLGKQVVYIAQETDQLRFAHMHLHLSLINLSQIHHLVDESENTFGITANGFIDAATMGIVILLDE